MYETVEAIEGGTSRGERMVRGILQSLDLSNHHFVSRFEDGVVVVVGRRGVVQVIDHRSHSLKKMSKFLSLCTFS